MKQYIDLVKEVLADGIWKGPARAGLPRTKEIFCRTMRFDLSQGFPLVTTKRMYARGFVTELLWMLRGDTTIRYLVNNGVHIWDDDTYRYYRERGGSLDKEQWLEAVASGAVDRSGTPYGYVGAIYGPQWRAWQGYYDQIRSLISKLKHNPDSRYMLVSAWNPVDFFTTGQNNSYLSCLPACHVMFQCCVREDKLDIMMLQRSCDLFLGVPFDIAGYALLCHILAKEVGLKPGIFTWVGNSIHLYENHIEQAKELVTREPFPLCQLVIAPNKRKFDEYEPSDFVFVDYKSHAPIKAPLSVGQTRF